MKKKLAGFCAAALALSMTMMTAVCAEPVDNENITGATSAEVKGTYTSAEEPEKVYSVDLSWAGMTFTYQEASKGTWDPKEHKYTNAGTAEWSGQGTITVVNHSNAAIEVVPTYTPETAYQTADMRFSAAKLQVASADNAEGENGNGTSKSGTITVTPTGSLPAGTNNVKIGTITLSITEAASMSGEQE